MTLTTCKKCAKIFTSGAASCPYCGAVISQCTADPGEIQGDFRTAVIGFFLGFFLLFTLIFTLMPKPAKNTAADPSRNCLSAVCPAETKAVTDTNQPYYNCKSGELSDYANYVLSVLIAQEQSAGIAPEITAKTGEPVVQGKEKTLLDKYRANAGVSSFEDAIAKCYRGVGNLRVVVLYNPVESSNSIYVSSEENPQDKFWLPKDRLGKQ